MMTDRLLDNIGIKIRMADIPECQAYGRLNDELARMHPIRRWLSFRKRRKCAQAKLQAQAAIMNNVIEKGQTNA